MSLAEIGRPGARATPNEVPRLLTGDGDLFGGGELSGSPATWPNWPTPTRPSAPPRGRRAAASKTRNDRIKSSIKDRICPLRRACVWRLSDGKGAWARVGVGLQGDVVSEGLDLGEEAFGGACGLARRVERFPASSRYRSFRKHVRLQRPPASPAEGRVVADRVAALRGVRRSSNGEQQLRRSGGRHR